MTLQQKFDQIVQQNDWWQAGQRVVVAVSTGVDSMVLLDLLQHLATKAPEVIVAYVDHQLRDQSRQETAFIKDYCQIHQLTLAMTTWPKAQHPGGGIETAARKFRYRFFGQVLDKWHATVLLTAHHGDDLAETMLMKLVRGGQLASLVGIADCRSIANGKLVRPLLDMSKQEIRGYAADQHLTWFEDATNRDLGIERNRIRHQVLPELKRENPHVLRHFREYSQQLTDYLDATDELVGAVVDQAATKSSDQNEMVLNLNQLPTSRQGLSLILAFVIEKRMGIVDVTHGARQQLNNLVLNSALPQATMPLPHGGMVIKSYGKLIIRKKDHQPVIPAEKAQQFMVILDRWYSLQAGGRFGLFHKRPDGRYKVTAMRLTAEQLPAMVRPWHHGDRIALKNGGHQKVHRVLIDAKVPNDRRERVSVLVAATGDVLAVLGIKSRPMINPDAPQLYLVESNQSFLERKGIDNG